MSTLYNQKDHTHCFDQKEAPCGIKDKHRCCLCEMEVPTENKDWREEFEKLFAYKTYDFLHDKPELFNHIKSFIFQVESSAIERTKKEYELIFKWLLGEYEDFPDLSQKPHYSFRKELRQKLASLQPNPTSHE